jgi:hypothetical protein
LKREEFRIFDDGVAQEIRLFELPGSLAPNASNVFTNQSAQERSGYAVILIDTLHTNFGDPIKVEEGSGFAIAKTHQLLQSMSAKEKIAIYALHRKLQVICEFTSDRNLLEQASEPGRFPSTCPPKAWIY